MRIWQPVQTRQSCFGVGLGVGSRKSQKYVARAIPGNGDCAGKTQRGTPREPF
jgi:hypothetical protein